MRIFLKLLAALILNSHSLLMVAQDSNVLIKLTDNLTGEPLRDVAILLNDSVITKTNFGGYLEFPALKNDVVSVAADKYEPKVFTISDGRRFQVRLDRQDAHLEYSEGVSNFYGYFQRNLRYPEKAIHKEIQADVYVEFTIDSLGRSRLINVHNDELNVFKKSIERVFIKIPGNWSTSYAKKTFVLPVSFRMNGENKTLQKMEPKGDRILNTVVIGYHKF